MMLINAGTLKGMLRVIPRGMEDVAYRPALFGLTFEPDGTIMATDGHVLLAFKSGRTFEGEPFMVSADVLRAAIKGQKAKYSIDVCALAPGENAPPPWRRTIPAEYSGSPGDYSTNPELVLTLRDAVNDINETEGLSSKARPVKVLLLLANGNSPWLAYASDRVLAIVMPLRQAAGDTHDRMRTCAADFMKPDPLA